KFCGLDNRVHIKCIKPGELPFPGKSFDKIYIESVLAILTHSELIRLVESIRHSLKQNGMLIVNETLWKEDADPKKIQEINDYCKKHFGIVQCSGDLPNVTDLIKFFS